MLTRKQILKTADHMDAYPEGRHRYSSTPVRAPDLGEREGYTKLVLRNGEYVQAEPFFVPISARRSDEELMHMVESAGGNRPCWEL